ncbi:MAG: DUF3833 domain-containing protein [Casimicrobiaceae bacterium]
MPFRTIARALALATFFALLQGCANVKIDEYAGEKPLLDLRSYFNGHVDAWGMFQDRSGKVIKRFSVKVTGTWSGSTGTLDERFTYSDGTTQRRVWTIRQDSANRYVGTADDVVGEAIGEAAGNALRWRYVMALPVDGKVYNVDFDDWMYQMDDRVMLNRSAMSKFGFRLGEVTLSFVKPAAQP